MFKVKCFLFNQTGPGLTLCQNVYQDNWRQGKNWVPRCTKDGKFEPVQCHSGVCFCVDNYGVERRGSHTWALINGRPRCNEGILFFKCRSAGDVFNSYFHYFKKSNITYTFCHQSIFTASTHFRFQYSKLIHIDRPSNN